MKSRCDIIISKIVECLAKRPGVRAVALVGSRAAGNPELVDQYSDADFLVCCQDDERRPLLSCDWVDSVEKPVLIFPKIMNDEIRVLFSGLFACELHILTLSEIEKLSGPCKLGSQISAGLLIEYDPETILAGLATRVQPEPPDVRNPEISSSVFWYNLVYCANLIMRGDLFRASQFSNWYLQLFLLDLIYSIEEYGAKKYVADKLRPDQYQALAATVSPLDRLSMIDGLKRCMDCYWKFQTELAPDINPEILAAYRCIEREIRERLDKI